MGSFRRALSSRFVRLNLIGFLCLALQLIIDAGVICGALHFAALVIYIYLTCMAADKKELKTICISFVAGTIVKYLGLTGYVVTDIVLVGIISAAVYVLFIIYRILTRIVTGVHVIAVFSILWTIWYLIGTIIRLPSIMRLDYYWFDFGAFVQIEEFITTIGLTAIIAGLAALVAYTLVNKKMIGVIQAVAIAAAIIVFGAIRLVGAQEPDFTVRVAYSTGPYIGNFINYGDISYEEQINSFNASVREAAVQGASIIAFNEESVAIDYSEESRFLSEACALAKENNIHILVGLEVSDDTKVEKSENKILWIDNNGEKLGEYLKRNTIPFLESKYKRGENKIPTYNINAGGHDISISFAICYDSNFPLYIGQISGETDVLFLPSWDWKAVTDMHYRLCGTLAVENSTTVIKPTYDGYTVVADKYGRVAALTNTNDTGYENVQIVDLPIIRGGVD